ncbi:uncharacterized protein A4U43_C10F6480 [Asparagus officinalis]|uniref:WRKY domain-containing protein n=1 Tax=Asparagus officinalis TaxID=4686 RepID=A0A5P1E5M3_ASPOF|nr:probable WRKY transcription factor 12 [Asparagus officinalis]ONK56306.1 uncharacterized protein A4U43_C10F6480 [Asparagus officinalis]
MEGRGGPTSRCYVLELPSLSNLEFRQHQPEVNHEGLFSFTVASKEDTLIPFDGHQALANACNPNSRTWSNEKMRISDPKAGIDQDLSAGRDGGSSSWWKRSGPEKGKTKVRRKMREPRFCFQTRSDVDVLDDGYKWRKYGQKIVKNSLHPRSYFRCTHHNCRVKKRVERLSEDCRMVITTYEGRHTHAPDDDTNSSEPECFTSF